MADNNRTFAFVPAVIAVTAAIAGEEKPYVLSEVPEEIVAIAKAKVADVELVSANTEAEPDGGFVYEIQGRFADGRKVEFDIYPNGKIQEIEFEFRSHMVPGAVFKAVERKLPGFEPTFIEASHSPSLKVVRYELVGKLGNSELDIEVSADGRNIVVADR